MLRSRAGGNRSRGDARSSRLEVRPLGRDDQAVALAMLDRNPVRDTRMVSPMPSASSAPMPTADLTMPSLGVPASVTPRWSG